MQIFLSYARPIDRTIAVRLQAVASVHGIRAIIPDTAERAYPGASLHAARNLDDSDVVIGIATSSISGHMAHEIRYAQNRVKDIFLLVNSSLESQIPSQFQLIPRIAFDVNQPLTQVEGQVISRLSNLHSSILRRREEKSILRLLLVAGLIFLGLYLITRE